MMYMHDRCLVIAYLYHHSLSNLLFSYLLFSYLLISSGGFSVSGFIAIGFTANGFSVDGAISGISSISVNS